MEEIRPGLFKAQLSFHLSVSMKTPQSRFVCFVLRLCQYFRPHSVEQKDGSLSSLLENIWKDTVIAWLEAISRNSSEKREENHAKPPYCTNKIK
jgi:hypothetical protein